MNDHDDLPPPRLGVVPESLLAWKNGWSEMDETNQAFTVIDEEEFFTEQMGDSLKDTFVLTAESIDRALSQRGREVNAVNIFHFLLELAIDKIVDFTTQSLIASGKTATTKHELWTFFATIFLRSAFNLSTAVAWKQMESGSAGFVLMDMKRYNSILHNLRGYDMIGRSPENADAAWMQRSNLLRNMNGLERSFFERSVTHLLNKHNGVLVIDDELISSRASDVETKTISNRKAGKEGPVSDCVSCSVTNILYGARLRVKGESQSDNVEELTKTFLRKDTFSGGLERPWLVQMYVFRETLEFGGFRIRVAQVAFIRETLVIGGFRFGVGIWIVAIGIGTH
jgi:hypothetical protein